MVGHEVTAREMGRLGLQVRPTPLSSACKARTQLQQEGEGLVNDDDNGNGNGNNKSSTRNLPDTGERGRSNAPINPPDLLPGAQLGEARLSHHLAKQEQRRGLPFIALSELLSSCFGIDTT